MRVVVTGASGLVGRALTERLITGGHTVVGLSRSPERAAARQPEIHGYWGWHPDREPAPAEALTGADAVVHLLGESVAGLWTSKKRRAIRDSRVEGTRNLIGGLRAVPAEGRPRQLVSASAMGYYGDRGEDVLAEDEPAGTGLMAGVCELWEAAAQEGRDLGLAVACLRSGLVLDRRGGGLPVMARPTRLGLGGPLGGGRQWWAWPRRRG